VYYVEVLGRLNFLSAPGMLISERYLEATFEHALKTGEHFSMRAVKSEISREAEARLGAFVV